MGTPLVYPCFKQRQHNGNGGDLDAASAVKIAVLKSTYSYSSSHTLFSDVSSHEVSGTGYASGGYAVANPTALLDGETLEYAHDDVDVAQNAAGFADGRVLVWYFAATGHLIMRCVEAADFGNVAGPLKIDGSAATGVLQLS